MRGRLARLRFYGAAWAYAPSSGLAGSATFPHRGRLLLDKLLINSSPLLNGVPAAACLAAAAGAGRLPARRGQRRRLLQVGAAARSQRRAGRHRPGPAHTRRGVVFFIVSHGLTKGRFLISSCSLVSSRQSETERPAPNAAAKSSSVPRSFIAGPRRRSWCGSRSAKGKALAAVALGHRQKSLEHKSGPWAGRWLPVP